MHTSGGTADWLCGTRYVQVPALLDSEKFVSPRGDRVWGGGEQFK